MGDRGAGQEYRGWVPLKPWSTVLQHQLMHEQQSKTDIQRSRADDLQSTASHFRDAAP